MSNLMVHNQNSNNGKPESGAPSNFLFPIQDSKPFQNYHRPMYSYYKEYNGVSTAKKVLSWLIPGFLGSCTAGSYVQIFFHDQ